MTAGQRGGRALLFVLMVQALPARAERLITLDVQEADARAILMQVAEAGGLDLSLSESVKGRLSLRVSRKPALSVLDGILLGHGWGRDGQGRRWLVAPLDELALRARQTREWQTAQEARLALDTRLIPLRHARAVDLARLAAEAGAGERLLGPRGRVDADARTNTLLVTDHAGRLARWPAWLEVLDRPGRQVVVETRLAAVSRTRASQIGLEWGFQRPSVAARVPLAVAGSDVSSLRYGLLAVDGKTLDVTLSALESRGDGEIIARPGVMTAEQQTARIASGQQIPYQETTQSGASTTRFIHAELSLEVTPSISADGDIQLDIRLSQDSPGELQPSGARAIETNRLSTQVRMRHGETLMLGGIFRQQHANSVSRVPGLGNIPVLGVLFRRQLRREDRQELLVFVTPRLAEDGVVPALPAIGKDDG